jgi:hypothetical protein
VPDPGLHSPLVDFFRRGEVARDVRLLAAQGAMAPRAMEQLALLVLLSDDPDREVARAAAVTLDALPVDLLSPFLARSDVPREMKVFFASLGIEPSGDGSGADSDEPLLDTSADTPEEEEEADADVAEAEPRLLSSLPVLKKMKIAMKGTREQRAQLVRDTNKLVASAVLASPKLTEQEVETFTKMGNVSEDTLRTIGHNRKWLKNYGVLVGLCRHPKTPPAISMQLIHRLNERELKAISTDRNVQEGLRVLARKMVTKNKP